MRDFATSDVAAAFAAFPETVREGVMMLRELIFDVAEDESDVPELTEGLRWGQPAYLTPAKIGSPVRLGVPKSGGFALYAQCQTTIISDFAQAYPGWDKIEGNRAVHFKQISDIDPVRHGALVRSALTYHLRRKG